MIALNPATLVVRDMFRTIHAILNAVKNLNVSLIARDFGIACVTERPGFGIPAIINHHSAFLNPRPPTPVPNPPLKVYFAEGALL